MHSQNKNQNYYNNEATTSVRRNLVNIENEAAHHYWLGDHILEVLLSLFAVTLSFTVWAAMTGHFH